MTLLGPDATSESGGIVARTARPWYVTEMKAQAAVVEGAVKDTVLQYTSCLGWSGLR